MRNPRRATIVMVAAILIGLGALALPASAAAAPWNGEPGSRGMVLSNWKIALTSILLLVGLAQFFGQAVVRGWIKVKSGNKKLLANLHRPGGIAAFTLTLVVLGMCLYAMYGPDGGGLGMLYNARVVLHAVFGGLLMLVLIAKAIVSNFVRRQLKVNVPLGIAAGVLTLGVFALSVIPHVFRLG